MHYLDGMDLSKDLFSFNVFTLFLIFSILYDCCENPLQMHSLDGMDLPKDLFFNVFIFISYFFSFNF